MKKTLLRLICLFSVLTISTFAQRNLDFGVSTGITNYFGDLGNDEFFQASSTRPGVALTVRNLIAPNALTGQQYSAFNVEARLSWHRIGYDETQSIGPRSGFELRNYGRGLSFRTDIVGLSGHVTYTYYPNKRLPLYKQHAVIFLFTGAGVFYADPKADLFMGSIDPSHRYYFWQDGTTRDHPQSDGFGNVVEKDGKYETHLRDWNTEGQGASNEGKGKKKYSPFHVGIPVGMGFRFGITPLLTYSIEFGYYHFFSDYLDDVSTSYATYKNIEEAYPNDPEKQALAQYISDPTGYGTNGFEGTATSQRGNPKLKDSYSFINMEIAYRIKWNPNKIKNEMFGWAAFR